MNTTASVRPSNACRAARSVCQLVLSAFSFFEPRGGRHDFDSRILDPGEHLVFEEGPRDCFLVLDASPSMLEDDWPPSRLGAGQDAAKAFIRAVHEQNLDSRVAIIAYGKRAQVHCPLTPARNLRSITKAIDKISFINSTNITAGLKAVDGLIRRSDHPIQIVVLSDGHHNWGPRPIDLANKLKKRAIIETVGIGGSPSAVDEPLLRNVASKRHDGTPRYRWIGDRAALVQHFYALGGGLTRE